MKFPANIKVAPNSDSALAHDRAKPPRIVGDAIGKVILKKVLIGVTPSVSDISSSSLGKPS